MKRSHSLIASLLRIHRFKRYPALALVGPPAALVIAQKPETPRTAEMSGQIVLGAQLDRGRGMAPKNTPMKPALILLAAMLLGPFDAQHAAEVAPASQPALASIARVPLKVEPVRSSTAAEVNGKTFDLVIIGATPGGIACAVRAVRERCTVWLVQHNRHIGGMLINEAVRSVWLDGFKLLKQGTLDAAKFALAVHAAESKDSPATNEVRGDVLLRLWKQLTRQP